MPIRKHPQDVTGNQRLIGEKIRDDAKALELNNDDKRKLVAGLRSTTGQRFVSQAELEEVWRGIEGLSTYISREVVPSLRDHAECLDALQADKDSAPVGK